MFLYKYPNKSIITFWEEKGYAISYFDRYFGERVWGGVKEINSALLKNRTIAYTFPDQDTQYFFNDKKIYTEAEMLKIIKLKAFF